MKRRQQHPTPVTPPSPEPPPASPPPEATTPTSLPTPPKQVTPPETATARPTTAPPDLRERVLDNLVFVGQSGVGKSHLIQGLGRAACALGYRVRSTTSAALIEQLTASLADQTLPRQVRKYAAFDWLIVDEFGFDRLERREARDAASLLFKLIDARNQKRATALVTNIDFDGWGEYLGDPPLATALLDRIVDGAIIVKINGKSYRAHGAQPTPNKKAAKA